MARGSKRQRKKIAKRMGTWEIKNDHGVIFTQEQKRALERAVNRSNRMREEQIKRAEALRPEKTQLRLMGKESDFIITHQSNSLQRFKSMEEYTQFMDKQARIHSGEYLVDRTRLYKSNYMKAIQNVFGKAGDGVRMRVRMMPPEKFREMVETKGDEMEISYIYDPQTMFSKLTKIRSLLGMRELEGDPFLEG